MKAKVREVTRDGKTYTQLAFVCPGCIAGRPGSDGVHMLPVNSEPVTPSWQWNGSLEEPTLSPSILTHGSTEDNPNGFKRCHSYLKQGIFEFLNDSEHELAGKKVPMPDLPDWVVRLS